MKNRIYCHYQGRLDHKASKAWALGPIFRKAPNCLQVFYSQYTHTHRQRNTQKNSGKNKVGLHSQQGKEKGLYSQCSFLFIVSGLLQTLTLVPIIAQTLSHGMCETYHSHSSLPFILLYTNLLCYIFALLFEPKNKEGILCFPKLHLSCMKPVNHQTSPCQEESKEK